MPEKHIGKILHFWPRAGAAQVELDPEAPPLRVGDRVRIRGHGHDFIQPVESLEIDHIAKSEGWPGEHVALAVMESVHENDDVLRVT
jgi:hypothetical protein